MINVWLVSGAALIFVLVRVVIFASSDRTRFEYFSVVYQDIDPYGNTQPRHLDVRIVVEEEDLVQLIARQSIRREPDVPVGKWITLDPSIATAILEQKKTNDVNDEGRIKRNDTYIMVEQILLPAG